MEMLPDPRLKSLEDQTELAVMQFDKMAPGRQFCDVVAVKADFDWAAQTPPVLMPGEFCLADRFRNPDDPLGASLSAAGDLILGKPGTDILVTGAVKSPEAKPHWPVHVAVTDAAEKILIDYRCIVTGPRRWRHSRSLGWHLGESTPADAVPIEYELGWGGRRADPDLPQEQWAHHEINPSGTGFSFAGISTEDQPRGPQWNANLARPDVMDKELAGLGPVARFWRNRLDFAGTYDAAWRTQFEAGLPDYPKDFDLRFFQCAHPALQTALALRGDESLWLRGVFKTEQTVRIRLPRVGIEAALGKAALRLPLDTVHLDLERNRVSLVWRLVLPHAIGVAHVRLSTRSL